MRSGSPTRATDLPSVCSPRPFGSNAMGSNATGSNANGSKQGRLESLLRDLGSDLRRGPGPESESDAGAHSPTGLPELDQLLAGGLPRGRLSEIVGPSSSGMTSLALSLLARTTRDGHCAGWIDCADAFDPASATTAGVELERVLWVRPPSQRDALLCVERLLETDGFPLIVLDRAGHATPHEPTCDPHAWLRLARLAASAQCALVLLGPRRCAGSSAHVALELRPAEARWSEGLVLLERLEIEIVLARHRAAPTGRSVRVAAPGTCAA